MDAPSHIIDPYIMDPEPSSQSTGSSQTTSDPLERAVPSLVALPPLRTILPPFFANQPQTGSKTTRILNDIDTTDPPTPRKHHGEHSSLSPLTNSTSKVPTSTSSTLQRRTFTSTFPLPPWSYMPAVDFKNRAYTAVNDTRRIATVLEAQKRWITNPDQASDAVVLSQSLLTPVFPINQTITRSQAQAQVAPPPPKTRYLHMTPQFHRPGYMRSFPDAELPNPEQWVDYMTRHETYDPILVRLREAMDDVPAFCHTSYAPFATPEQYQQFRDFPCGRKGTAPLFEVSSIISNTLRAKDGTLPTVEAIKMRRREIMQRIHEYLDRLLEMKNEGAAPLERIDALEDMSNRELRRSGLFRTVTTKLG